MISYTTLGMLLATASCNQGTDMLYAETRSGPRDAEKSFTPEQGVVYGDDDLLYAETKSDDSSKEKVFVPVVDEVYEESPRFLQGLYDETSNAPAEGEDKELSDPVEPVYGEDGELIDATKDTDSASKIASGIVSLAAIVALMQ